MKRWACIHGHFYQPPRESPWLGEVEAEAGAAPFHDWNERITAECYAPATAARLLDSSGKVSDIVNLFSTISWNVGPTLFSWLEYHAPDVYAAVLEADRESLEHFSGHGTAIAQPYRHIILPLASQEDREIEVAWGIHDFSQRFLRRPEGMWLPELAVDTPTLETLAAAGIRFTILAPHQALRVRRAGGGAWTTVLPGGLDIHVPYLVRLPSGRSLAVFFYDGGLSGKVAFGDLLADGASLAGAITHSFPDDSDSDMLVSVATDGETFGHHKKFGEMGLARCIDVIRSGESVSLTVFGEYLASHPPVFEVEVHEMSSWSCSHGVERWRSACGCGGVDAPGASLAWRAPLRRAMDLIRGRIRTLSASILGEFFSDPGATLRDAVILAGPWSEETWRLFLATHACRTLSPSEETTCARLLEMVRHARAMYTSCGWFFESLGRVEGVQVLRYAARTMQLAALLGVHGLQEEFVAALGAVPSGDPDAPTAADVYLSYVVPKVYDPCRVAAHYALMVPLEVNKATWGNQVVLAKAEVRGSVCKGLRRASFGTVSVLLPRTMESATIRFLAVNDPNTLITLGYVEDGAVATTPGSGDEERAARDACCTQDPGDVLMRQFGQSVLAWNDLSPGERAEVVAWYAEILERSFGNWAAAYSPLILALNRHFLQSGSGLFPVIPLAASHHCTHAVAGRLPGTVGGETAPGPFLSCCRESIGVSDLAQHRPAFAARISALFATFAEDPLDPAPLREVRAIINAAGQPATLSSMPAVLRGLFPLIRRDLPFLRGRARSGDRNAGECAAELIAVAQSIGVRVP
ncbi:MAG: DUF3536 domain-containing protein [Methanomicrobiales archaeon]|jgi:hypothetical protein|nr:DUF3536 domain-containing protein [Methanomicrobiales archaeon]